MHDAGEAGLVLGVEIMPLIRAGAHGSPAREANDEGGGCTVGTGSIARLYCGPMFPFADSGTDLSRSWRSASSSPSRSVVHTPSANPAPACS